MQELLDKFLQQISIQSPKSSLTVLKFVGNHDPSLLYLDTFAAQHKLVLRIVAGQESSIASAVDLAEYTTVVVAEYMGAAQTLVNSELFSD